LRSGSDPQRRSTDRSVRVQPKWIDIGWQVVLECQIQEAGVARSAMAEEAGWYAEEQDNHRERPRMREAQLQKAAG
jgi:hypothetical protein